MAATDQHYRNQKTLNIVFAVSCVAMFLSVIWMLYDDYKKDFKQVQREFRDVEESVSLSAMLEALPKPETLDEARKTLAAAREKLEEKRKELESKRKELVAVRDKADTAFQDVKATFDSRSSYRDIDVEHLGAARTTEEREHARKALEARDVELRNLKEKMSAARTNLDDAIAALDREVHVPLKPYEEAVTRAEDYLKEINGTFDRFAKVSSEKKWKFGDTFRNLPILDGFASPVRINQIVLNDLPIDYGGFKDVTRYDRCATCHMGIDSATYTRQGLEKVANTRPPEKAISDLIQAVKSAEVKNAKAEVQLDDLKQKLNEQLADVRKAFKEKSSEFNTKVNAFLKEAGKAEALADAKSWQNIATALERLKVSAEQQTKLWIVHDLLKERKGEKNITFNPSDVPTELREVKLTRGQITQYAAHPRLDLFVDANSPHPMEKFGCTICHSGQGSATAFGHAAHMPNDAEQKKLWEGSGEGGYHWHMVHAGDWAFPMNPKRFVESSCLKCHHQVTDLVRFGTKEEAPRLMEGYNLVKENGCFGCHEIAGTKGGRPIGPDLRLEPTPALEWLPVKDQLASKADTLNPPGTLRKVGPSLRRLSEKSPDPKKDVVNNWLLNWIKDPRGFRPDTKMPHFYEQATNNAQFLNKEWEDRNQEGNNQALYPNAEIYSIAYYLQTESAKFLGGEDSTRMAVREDLLGKVKQLEAAVNTVGSLAGKEGLTTDDKIKLSRARSEQTRLKKDADGLRRRYRDLSLMSRPLEHASINEKGEYLQSLLDNVTVPNQTPDDLKKLFVEIVAAIKTLQDASTPLVPLAAKDDLIDSNGKKVSWSKVPEPAADVAAGKTLFTEKGCMACHSHVDVRITHSVDGENVPEISEANFGPELSRIAHKLNPDKKEARRWLIQWILNPNVYHPRTRMPVTHLSEAQVAQIADWLLSASDKWTAGEIEKPSDKTLIQLAELALSKVPAIGKQHAEKALTEGLKKEYRALLAPDSDEQLLVEGNHEGPVDTPRLLRYVGKKAIGRMGCYACHDIPGFEAAKPIGTQLNDWGKKDAERLAFEDGPAFLKNHFTVAEMRDDPTNPTKPSSIWLSKDGKTPIYEQFYAEALEHHQREGFLSLKLAEPRSYDYGRVRAWDDRLRMPQFKFARTHRRMINGTKESIDAFKERRAREGKGEYDAYAQFQEARSREAVMTFVLGLVADPVPLKFVNNPKPDRLAEIKGLQVLEKYNCAGCHEVRPGFYEFKIPEAKKAEFLSLLGTSEDPKDHVFTDSSAWVGRPSPVPGQQVAFGVSTDDRPTFKGEEKVYRIRLTEAFPYKDGTGVTRNRPSGEILDIPGEGVISASETYGGDFARLVAPHLGKVNKEKFGSRTNQRAALPPPLLREGERVQPQWLFKFLLNPTTVRPWTVLRMPRFNMSDEEARALVEYFAAVDKMNNPAAGLNESFAKLPQEDASFWQQKTQAYLKDMDKSIEHLAALERAAAVDKAKKEGKKPDDAEKAGDTAKDTLIKSLKDQMPRQLDDLPLVWRRYLSERIAQKEREVVGAEDLVKNAKKEEEAAFKARLEDSQKELKALKDELATAEKKEESSDFKQFRDTWKNEQVYATDGYKLLTDAKSICMTCHSVGSLRIANEQGPNLAMARERLRPRWTEQWIASPNRFTTYPTYMPQNFPRDGVPNPHYLIAPPRVYPEAARDVLMDLPSVGILPVNKYRLSPKGGK